MFLDYFLPCLGISLGIASGIGIVAVSAIFLTWLADCVHDAFDVIRYRLRRDR